MGRQVLFIQGAGAGAHAEDALLVASLRDALGPAYDVRYPAMRNEASPEYADWKPQLAEELAAAGDGVVLVGHSVGGSVLLKYLSEEGAGGRVSGLFLIAAPFWGGGDDEPWTWDDVRLPDDAGARLAGIPRVVFYQSRDDDVVPFAHLARYAALFPQAVIRPSDGRGHQLGNDLTDVAEDVRRDEAEAGWWHRAGAGCR